MPLRIPEVNDSQWHFVVVDINDCCHVSFIYFKKINVRRHREKAVGYVSNKLDSPTLQELVHG